MVKYLNVKMKSKGLTLIETLVAVTIFAIIVGAISGLFISAIRTQRRVLATQELLDQTSYVLEYMGRTLRMAKKDKDGDCTGTAEKNYISLGVDNIWFMDYNGDCVGFDNTDYQIKKYTASGIFDLTSSKIKVNTLKFIISGDNLPDDKFQPRVTIFLEAEGREAAGSRPKVQIQTSISQRNLDTAQ